MEKTQMSINRQMDKEDDVCIYNGILLNHKKRMNFCHLLQLGWTWRALCLVKYVRQRKTNTVCYHLYVESKK